MPPGGSFPSKALYLIKVNFVVADTSTRGWMQHGKKKNV
jgi:hypothetical protein